jgi:hypothetical protein
MMPPANFRRVALVSRCLLTIWTVFPPTAVPPSAFTALLWHADIVSRVTNPLRLV